MAFGSSILRAVPGATLAEIIGEQRPARVVRSVETPAMGQSLTVPVQCNTGIQPDGMGLDVSQLGATKAGAGHPAHISVPAIPVPEGTVPPTGDLFAVRVTAPGAEQLLAAGTLLVCRQMPDFVEDLPDGTLVILRCRYSGTTRIDVREVEHFDGRLWLWQRSTHPEHQQPQLGPQPLCGSHRAPGGETITIMGAVLASWQPEGPLDQP